MHYILNKTNQIIAADEETLSLFEAEDIGELSSKIIKDNISLDPTIEESITVETMGGEKTFFTTETHLYGLLGDLRLIHISKDTEQDKDTSILSDFEEDNTNLIDSIIQDEGSIEIEQKETTVSPVNDTEQEINLDDNFSLDDETVEPEKIEQKEEALTIEDDEIDFSDLFGDSNGNIKKEEISIEKVLDEEIIQDDIMDLGLSDIEEKKEKEDIIDLGLSIKEEKEDILDLGLSSIDNVPIEVNEPKTVEININIDEVSKEIGISTEDYQIFLNEFIDSALELEEDLQSNDNTKCTEATDTLSYLAETLHLPTMSDIINNISNANQSNKLNAIESFYGTLSRITTTEDTQKSESTSKEISEELNLDLSIDILDEVPKEQGKEDISLEEELELELFNEPEPQVTPPQEKEVLQKEVIPKETPTNTGFGTINLDSVKAKHFDFQLEEAANDLSLPVELIEEFVLDFIEQAHTETKKMLEFYEKGDLDAIQKIGHLLKGASSNLRIKPLADTLYKIQFCENPSHLEMLIKDYWAHFLSFENQINVISN